VADSLCVFQSAVPTASILGGPDLHFDKGLLSVCWRARMTLAESFRGGGRVNSSLTSHSPAGSTINLTCTIKYSPEPPAYIFWYHHDEVIADACVAT
jgi:hypothetical protein